MAVAAAVARAVGRELSPEGLWPIVRDAEARCIGVPTGVQDYRPALYGGVAAVDLRVDGVFRCALDIDHQALEDRIVLAYTGAPRNSGTNNWAITKQHLDGNTSIFDCFERIRDTAAAMKDYLSSFDPHLKGLTGDPAAVAKVLSAYRVYSKKVPLKDGDYTMDHTALIYLMDRDGHFVSPFNLKRTPDEAAKDLKRYL